MSGQDQNPDLPLPCMRGRRPGRIFVRPPPRHGHKPTWLAGFVRGPLDGTPDAHPTRGIYCKVWVALPLLAPCRSWIYAYGRPANFRPAHESNPIASPIMNGSGKPLIPNTFARIGLTYSSKTRTEE